MFTTSWWTRVPFARRRSSCASARQTRELEAGCACADAAPRLCGLVNIVRASSRLNLARLDRETTVVMFRTMECAVCVGIALSKLLTIRTSRAANEQRPTATNNAEEGGRRRGKERGGRRGREVGTTGSEEGTARGGRVRVEGRVGVRLRREARERSVRW